MATWYVSEALPDDPALLEPHAASVNDPTIALASATVNFLVMFTLDVRSIEKGARRESAAARLAERGREPLGWPGRLSALR
jgi:hypothetical protein